jgi:hypothetical protein
MHAKAVVTAKSIAFNSLDLSDKLVHHSKLLAK